MRGCATRLHTQTHVHTGIYTHASTQGCAHSRTCTYGTCTGMFRGRGGDVQPDACARKMNPLSCSSWTHQSPGVYNAYHVLLPSANSLSSTLPAPTGPGASHQDIRSPLLQSPSTDGAHGRLVPLPGAAWLSSAWNTRLRGVHCAIYTHRFPGHSGMRITCIHTWDRL